jgi:hypothetical protein
MKFEKRQPQKSGRSVVIDFQMIDVHTGRYVVARACLRSAEFSLDALKVPVHAGWHVGSTQESETWSDQAA